MKLEVGKKYTDGCTVLEIKFFDRQGTAWCLSDKKFCIQVPKEEQCKLQEVIDKPDPGEGWRLLEPSEDVKEGDEYFHTCIRVWLIPIESEQQKERIYRRRTTPQYVPYTWDDREELRDRWFKQKGDVLYERKVYNIAVERSKLFIDGWEAKEFLQKCEWLDGSPCGKRVV